MTTKAPAVPLFGQKTLDQYGRELANPPPENPLFKLPPRTPSTLKATAPAFQPKTKSNSGSSRKRKGSKRRLSKKSSRRTRRR